MRAAAAIADRGVVRAVPALRLALRSPEVYRAAAAARALTAFADDPQAVAGVAEARQHISVVVRRAVAPHERPGTLPPSEESDRPPV